MFRQLVFFALAFLFSWIPCQSEVDLKEHPINLIVDTDCDISDMMAILYLLNSPRVDIKAITTVGDGMARWEFGARNILNLLELAGHPRIPVAYGARKSLSPAGSFPPKWRNEADKVMGIKLPRNPANPVPTRSPELMTEIIMKNHDKTSILCIGPMTNIALALQKTPDLKDKIEKIYFMGGALMVPGNIVGRPQGFRNLVAEYNVFLDVKATQDVFDSGVPVILVTLDATEHVPVNQEFFGRISKDRKTPSANFVYEATNPYSDASKHTEEYFWDPLTAMIITHPEVALYREIKLTVNSKKGPEYGRLMMTKQGKPVQIATSINSEAFYNIFLETLNRPPNLKSGHVSPR